MTRTTKDVAEVPGMRYWRCQQRDKTTGDVREWLTPSYFRPDLAIEEISYGTFCNWRYSAHKYYEEGGGACRTPMTSGHQKTPCGKKRGFLFRLMRKLLT